MTKRNKKKYTRTPNAYHTAMLRLQAEAKRDMSRAYDNGDEELSRKYAFMEHEIEGCAESLDTVLGRLGVPRPNPPRDSNPLKKRVMR